MERIETLIKRALEEGLKTDKTELDQITGQPNTEHELGQTSAAWEKINEVLWAPGKEDSIGLLSGLRSAAAGITQAVNQALKECNEAAEALKKLEKAATEAQLYLEQAVAKTRQDEAVKATPAELSVSLIQDPSFAGQLQASWNAFRAAQAALKAVRVDTKGSTAAVGILKLWDLTRQANSEEILAHLEKKNNLQSQFDLFRTDARKLEVEYDAISHDRYLLESEYEMTRLAYQNGFAVWAKDEETLKAFTLYSLRQDRWPMQRESGIKWRELHSLIRGPEFYSIRKETINTKFRIQDGKTIWDPNPSDQLKVFDLPAAKQQKEIFLRFWYRLEGVINTLSEPNGPWDKEEHRKKAVDTAVSFQKQLDITLDNLSNLEEAIVSFNSGALDPLLAMGDSLHTDLQDLCANIHYGDFEDQQENLKEAIISLNQWTTQLEQTQRTSMEFNSAMDMCDHLGLAEMLIHELQPTEARPKMDFEQVVMGFEKIDLLNNGTYSVRAIRDLSNKKALIDTYPGSDKIKPLNVTVRMLELPRSHISEFGRVELDKSNPALLRTRVPVTFSNRYSSQPKVICWFEGLEVGHKENIRIRTWAESITNEGCVIALEGWYTTDVRHLEVCWFAHSADHPHVVSGYHSIVKRGFHSNHTWGPFQRVSFPEGKFPKRRPHVFAALSILDLNRLYNARCQVGISGVTQTGMRIALSPWWDTDCYQADCTWLAFDEDFYKNHLKPRV
ncbi:hypothetical protein ACHAPT_011076 [Fusarium lateritium]